MTTPDRGVKLPRYADYGLLIVLGAVWGSSFLLIKYALATLPPITVMAGRVAVGAIVLAFIVAARRSPWPRLSWSYGGRLWRLLAIMGVLGNVIPFSLINWGEVRIDSGLTAILMSTVPLATIILAPALVSDEPITRGKIAGVLLGMAGVAVLIGPGLLLEAHGEVLGKIAVTVAAVSYALNGLVARRLPKMPVEVISAGALVCAAVAALPVCFVVDRPWQFSPSLGSLTAVVGLGVINTAAGYLLRCRRGSGWN